MPRSCCDSSRAVVYRAPLLEVRTVPGRSPGLVERSDRERISRRRAHLCLSLQSWLARFCLFPDHHAIGGSVRDANDARRGQFWHGSEGLLLHQSRGGVATGLVRARLRSSRLSRATVLGRSCGRVRSPDCCCGAPGRILHRLRPDGRINKCPSVMARPAGFEPATSSLEGSCSIQLSYGRARPNN